MALLIDPPLRNSWPNTFVTSAHDDTLNKFAMYLNNAYMNERKIAAGTEPPIVFLITAHPGKVAKLVHHLYHDNGTPLSIRTNDILALHGHDVIAVPVLISKESFKALIPDSTVPMWEKFAECTSTEDIAALEPPITVHSSASIWWSSRPFLQKPLCSSTASIPKSLALPPSKPSMSTPPIMLPLAWPLGTRTPSPPILRKRAPLSSLFYSSSGYLRPRPTLSNPSTC